MPFKRSLLARQTSLALKLQQVGMNPAIQMGQNAAYMG
jgi:hypothetical protein